MDNSAHLDSDSSISGEFEKSTHMRVLYTDQNAWNRFISLYSPLIRYWIYRRGVATSDVDNIEQDIFTRLLTALRGFSSQTGSGKFRSWLRTITNNIVNDHFRKNGDGDAFGGSEAMKMMHQIPNGESSVGNMFDSMTENADEDAILYRRIMTWLEGRVAKLQVTVFRLVVIEERPVADVAAQFDITPGRVYQIKSRLLRKIRDEFAGML
ncbi:MAG: sigma-70 family RNA polymerase sigma factor [Planctomycetota bacterium]